MHMFSLQQDVITNKTHEDSRMLCLDPWSFLRSKLLLGRTVCRNTILKKDSWEDKWYGKQYSIYFLFLQNKLSYLIIFCSVPIYSALFCYILLYFDQICSYLLFFFFSGSFMAYYLYILFFSDLFCFILMFIHTFMIFYGFWNRKNFIAWIVTTDSMYF